MGIAGVELAEDPSRTVVLSANANGQPRTVTRDELLAQLVEGGYGGLALDEGALAQAAQRISQGVTFSAAVARRVDARYQVAISTDKLSATLSVVPPRGGAEASVEGAMAALAKAGVVAGVDAAAVGSAVTAASGDAVLVARGEPARHGADAWLEPLVDVNINRHPHIDDKGHVDFRDMGEIPTVQAGDALMKRHPPTEGVKGRNVLGGEIPAVNGKDLKFAVRLQGVAVDPQDPDLLRAETVGQPILLRDGISVEPVLRLNTVDVASGNVKFGGSVIVMGEICTGMKIEVDGDITVEGVIEAAEIHCGGDLKARGGIIGNAPPTGQAAQASGQAARVSAKGNVTARYAENAVIVAEQSVIIEESLVQCDVTAVDRVTIGKRGKKKGHVLGGFVRATLGVEAEFLGGPGSGQTRVFVGVNPMMQKAVDEQKKRLAAKLAEHGELTKVLKILKTRPDKKELFDKARATLQKVSEEIAEAMAEEKRLNEQLGHADEAEIRVWEGVTAGTMIAVGKKSRYLTDDGGGTAFRLRDGELVQGD